MNRSTQTVGRTSVRQTGRWAWPIFAVFVILLTSPATHAAELGRLFFTPQERAKFEMLGAAKMDSPVVQRESLTVNGMIQKSGGKRIFWINGEQQDGMVSPGKAPASVRVTVPGSSEPVELKVGQRIELNPVQTAPAE